MALGLLLPLAMAAGARAASLYKGMLSDSGEGGGHDLQHDAADDGLLKMIQDQGLLPQGNPLTAQGCTCSASACKADATKNDCEWCWTEGACGHRTWLGWSWDVCVFPEMDFERKAHADKLNQVWQLIKKEPQDSGDTDMTKVVSFLWDSSARTIFDVPRDVRARRIKAIHQKGAHCKVEMEVTGGSKFTGLLAPGRKIPGIMRCGRAVDGKREAAGCAFKFFRSGMPSANIPVLTDGGNNLFFAKSFFTHVPLGLQLRPIVPKFSEGSTCPGWVGVSQLATHDQEGNEVGEAKVNYPFELEFEPEGHLQDLEAMKAKGFTDWDVNVLGVDYMKELLAIEGGTSVFQIYSYESPTARVNNERVHLGKLHTTSACIASVFGDMFLSFQHTRKEEDFRRRPEWLEQYHAANWEEMHWGDFGIPKPNLENAGDHEASEKQNDEMIEEMIKEHQCPSPNSQEGEKKTHHKHSGRALLRFIRQAVRASRAAA